MPANHELSAVSTKVLIIGAGISGLLLAQGLKQAKIPFAIFEQDASLFHRSREWTIALHWARSDLKSLLPPSLYARLSEAWCDPNHDYSTGADDTTTIYNTQSGEVLFQLPTPGLVRVSRGRLRKLFSDGLDIQFGKKLSEIYYGEDGGGVTAVFADGSCVEGGLVVGADGGQSFVRELLLGKELARAKKSGIHTMGMLVKYEDPELAKMIRKDHPITVFGYHPHSFLCLIAIQEVPDPNDPTTWVFQIFNSFNDKEGDEVDHADPLIKLRGLSEITAEPFKSAYKNLPDAPTNSSSIKYWVTTPWDNHQGRVTLLGDAAHAMPPFRGQGLNNCICDCERLVAGLSSLNKTDLASIISEYEKEMIPRGRDEVELSLKTSLMVHNWDQLMDSPVMKMGIVKKPT